MKTETGGTLIKGLATGTISGLLITGMAAALVAKLLETEILAVEHMGYCVAFMVIAGAYMGSKVAFRMIKHRRLQVCLVSGGCYYGLLMCTLIPVLEGEIPALGATALLAVCGSVLAILI